jgi:hypothetical protein
MPIQINEIIIRAEVENVATPAPLANATVSPHAATNDAEIAALVLEIIKEKNER